MAINFPTTTGEATDGSFTHTASGITWSWDGTTWNAQGVTGTYSLPTASATVLGGIKVGSNLTIAGDGTLAAQTGASVNCFSTIQVSGQNNVVADSNSDTLTLAAGTNVTLATNNSSDTITINAAGGALTIQDEGVNSNQDATTINFVGAGVTVTGDGSSTKTVTIPGGGGGRPLRPDLFALFLIALDSSRSPSVSPSSSLVIMSRFHLVLVIAVAASSIDTRSSRCASVSCAQVATQAS